MPHDPARYVSTKTYLPPSIAESARKRAYSLGISISAYLAILLRNSLHHDRPPPSSVKFPERKVKLTREEIPISRRNDLHATATHWSNENGVTVSRLVEALVVLDLASGGDLTITPGP